MQHRLRTFDVFGARTGALYGATVAAPDARRAAAGVSAATYGSDPNRPGNPRTVARRMQRRRSWALWGLTNSYRPRRDVQLGSGI